MSENECKVKMFDEFFISEYDYLLGFTQSIDPKANYNDLLHDTYCRCKDRILVAGFSGETFLNWVRVSLMNGYKSNYRLEQKRYNIDFEDVNYYHNIEQVLQLKLNQEEQENEYNQQVSYLNTMVFSYINDKYGEKEKFVFKTYFLLKPKKINYKQLSEATGYSMTAVSNIIKRMKQDIKKNLENYINGRETLSGHTVGVGQ